MFWFIKKIFGREPIYGSKAGYKYGYKKDSVDKRDFIFQPRSTTVVDLPDTTDLRSKDTAIYDQGQLGSCTANAILGLFGFVCKRLFGDAFVGSRLMLYYNERVKEGSVNEDAGAEIRDGMATLNKDGVCPETMWPYDISKFANKPSDDCYAEGKKHIATKYMRVNQSLTDMKACLAEGFPFVFGFTVYSSFESSSVARTGIVPMPKTSKEEVLGGHAVMAVGYIDAKGKLKFNRIEDKLAYSLVMGVSSLVSYVRTGKGINTPSNCFIVRNSWGDAWGVNGYCYMPYAYLTDPDLCDDFWTIREVVDADKKPIAS